MLNLNTGDVIELPQGLFVYHNQAQVVTDLKTPVMAVVEATRHSVPFAVTGSDAHFEECFVFKARALNVDGSYFAEGALMTVALYGDFRQEFILPPASAKVLRKMERTFLPVAAPV